MVLRRVLVSLVLASVVPAGVITACRSKPQASEQPEASLPSPSAEPSTGESSEPPAETFVGDAGNRFRDAEPKVEAAESIRDAPVAAICAGQEIALAAIVDNPRCAIASGRAKQLRALLERDGGTPPTLKQEAKPTTDGRIAFRLVNAGPAPSTLPVSYSPALPAFTVLAEDEQHALYELEAPRLDVTAPARIVDAGDGHPRFARIVLAPGAAAVATITLSTTVVRSLARRGDAGSTPTLAKGRYVVHIGQLLIGVEAGDPARIPWEVR